MSKGIYEEFGIEGVVFILVVLICLFVFNLNPISSVVIGVVGLLITYFVKKGGL
jgi:hypothetical protein